MSGTKEKLGGFRPRLSVPWGPILAPAIRSSICPKNRAARGVGSAAARVTANENAMTKAAAKRLGATERFFPAGPFITPSVFSERQPRRDPANNFSTRELKEASSRSVAFEYTPQGTAADRHVCDIRQAFAATDYSPEPAAAKRPRTAPANSSAAPIIRLMSSPALTHCIPLLNHSVTMSGS